MRRTAAILAGSACLAVALTACGDDERPLRIGVVTDCVGINRPLNGAELAAAQLPLLQRGAQLRTRSPADGIEDAQIGGREVQLVTGCTETWEFSTLAMAVRLLVERDRVDAVVAAANGPDQLVLRDLARRHPDVVFVGVGHGVRELTLQSSPPNLFRFSADHGQGVAGLATYAYRQLGWRRAAIALGNWDVGWGERDAFAAEFCALGGRLAPSLAVDVFDPAGGDASSVPRDVDGVAVFAGSPFEPGAFVRRLVRERGRAHVVVGSSIADEPAVRRSAGAALNSVAAASSEDRASHAAYLGAYAKAFPGTPAAVAGSDIVTGYRDAMEALVSGIERADGDTAGLAAALGDIRPRLTGGPTALDGNRQGVVETSVVRIGVGGRDEPLAVRRGVDQSLGGLLPAARITEAAEQRCAPRGST